MASHPNVAHAPGTLQLTRATLYALTAAFMSLAGTVFWTAGYAAGLRSTGLLFTLFVMGASAALLVIVLWMLSQLHGAATAPHEAGARRGG
jgi:uncharacterized membrane protein YpjA